MDDDATRLEIKLQLQNAGMPDAIKACENPSASTVILTQGAFGTSEKEIRLLGLFVKYAGLNGKEVIVAPLKSTAKKNAKKR